MKSFRIRAELRTVEYVYIEAEDYESANEAAEKFLDKKHNYNFDIELTHTEEVEE